MVVHMLIILFKKKYKYLFLLKLRAYEVSYIPKIDYLILCERKNVSESRCIFTWG